MKYVKRFFEFLLWVLEELDRNMENHKEGLSMLGTVRPGTKVDKNY